jgi:putative ABC transport system permease protein
LQIIGVVGHVKQWSIDSDETRALQAQLYEPFWQLPGRAFDVGVVVRTEGAIGAGMFDALRRVIQSQHQQNVIYGTQTMNQVVARSLTGSHVLWAWSPNPKRGVSKGEAAPPLGSWWWSEATTTKSACGATERRRRSLSRQRFSMILLNSFAVVALLLASVGLYGVISYLVGQRSQEIGIRLALGAQRKDVLRLILRHGMKMSLSGVVLGLVAALGLTRLLSNLLYSVNATDPMTFAVITFLLVAVAVLACFVPAWRATKVDPLTALRTE